MPHHLAGWPHREGIEGRRRAEEDKLAIHRRTPSAEVLEERIADVLR